jgi:hypothetical protein
MPKIVPPASKLAAYRKKALLAAGVAAGVAMFGGVAHAEIMFATGNNPQPGEQNIMFETHFMGVTSFSGDTDQTNTPIEFNLIPTAKNGETDIGTDGIGQASIDCTLGCGTDNQGGANGSQLTDLEIKIGSGFGATDFLGNLDFGEGTALITVTDQGGTSFTYVLGNGQNKFTLTAIDGEVITDIQITESAADSSGNFGWNDFKQPRVSGICKLEGATCTAVPLPEPSSLALLGAGLFATGWFVRRRKARCKA